MKKNFLFIFKLCTSNNIFIEFSHSCFVAKDLCTRARLMERLSRDGVYKWHTLKTSTPSQILALATTKTSIVDWHSRIGHLPIKILNHIVKFFNLLAFCSSTYSFSCNLCKCNKIQKQSFSISSLLSTIPLDLNYFNVWRPSLVSSNDGFHCYMLLLILTSSTCDVFQWKFSQRSLLYFQN